MATAVVTAEPAERRWRLKLPERLPTLRGKWLTAYSLLWAAIAAISIVGISAGTIYRVQLGAGQTFTFGRLGVDYDDDKRVVRNVAGTGTGLIHSGETVLLVNGVRLPAKPDENVAQSIRATDQLRVPEGTKVRLTVQSPNGTRRIVPLISRAANARALYAPTGLTPELATWLCAIGFLLAPLVLIASAFLLYGRRRDPVAALLALCLMAWSCDFGSSIIAWTRWTGADIAQQIGTFLGIAGVIGLALAFLVFPRGRFEPRWTAILALLLPVFFLDLVFPGNPLLDDGMMPVLAVAVISMGIRYRRAPVGERQEWKWALLGFTASIGFIMVWFFGYRVYLQRHPGLSVDLWSWVLTPALAAVSMVFLVGGVTLSLLRYRLYDSSAAVSRSAAYGILTLGFVALFAGAEKLAEIIGETYFEHSIGVVAGAVGAAVAAAVVVPLHNRVHRWAERRFQKPLIRLRQGLPEYVADLRESAPVAELVSAVMKRVEAGVRSTREALLLEESGKLTLAGVRNVSAATVEHWRSEWGAPSAEHGLDCDKRDPLFPLRLRLCIETAGEPETIGWLLLGPRPDGSFFGKDEREGLEHVAGPVARAIHIAQLREERERRAEERIGKIEKLIASVAGPLAGGSPGPARA